jgi:hypothetical protein
MQPYFFPYLGYFQLLHAADRFVFYDDVAYIKGGWINRNRLLARREPQYFSVPILDASSFRPICETRFDAANERWKHKMMSTFAQSYADAPFRGPTLELIERVLGSPGDLIGDLARASVAAVLDHVGVRRDVVPTSSVYGNAVLKGQARVIDVCIREGATDYLNTPGGRSLYAARDFREAGVALWFLVPSLPPYPQRGAEFHPGLSILDALMWCPREQVAEMMADYSLESAESSSP